MHSCTYVRVCVCACVVCVTYFIAIFYEIWFSYIDRYANTIFLLQIILHQTTHVPLKLTLYPPSSWVSGLRSSHASYINPRGAAVK